MSNFIPQKEEHRRRVLANRVTKEIFVREIDEVSGGQRKVRRLIIRTNEM
jgi:hypothetical protein